MLSEQVIKNIENAIGVQDLASKISSTETIDSLEFGKTKHFTENDYRQQIINVQNDIPKEKWEEAKQTGIEMAIKELKNAHNLEFEGKTPQALYDYMNNHVEASKTGDIEKIKAVYEKDINQLRENLKEKDSEIESIKLGVKRNKIDSYVDNIFNQIQLEAPMHLKDEKQISEYIRLEREKNKTFFKAQYEFDIDEYDNVIAKKDGELVKDNNTMSPEKVDNLIQEYSKNSFMSLKQSQKGRGEGDRLPGSSMSNIKNMDELNTYAEKKGIKRNTSEFDALVIEFNKNQK
jgi:hypothetical protein